MRGRRALLVGAGSMGRAWATTLRDSQDVQIAGWIDLRPEVAARAAEDLALGDLLIGDDLERALAELRPDFVVDVTIPEAHRDVTLRALAAGVPVLGEKPMATSMAHAREMVAAAERAGVLYAVSQNRRYDPGLQAFRRLIHDELGGLGILNADFFIGAHFGGFRDEMDHPLLLDMAIHTFDAARYVSGADPVAVYCESFNPPWSWYRGDSSATALFEMSGGLRFTYRGSWCSDGRHTSWDAEWRAVGARGSATWDGAGTPVAEVVIEDEGFVRPTESRSMAPDESMARGLAGSLRDFLRALDTGEPPMTECHDNIRSLAMVFAAIESAETGRRVRVEW
jgi:predicted dehydrogenase